MTIKAVVHNKGKHLFRFKFWKRNNTFLPQKKMVPSHGSSSLAILSQAQLHFEKDSLRIRASFIPRNEIPGDLYVALELGIRSRKVLGTLRFGPFETKQVSGRIELVDASENPPSGAAARKQRSTSRFTSSTVP